MFCRVIQRCRTRGWVVAGMLVKIPGEIAVKLDVLMVARCGVEALCRVGREGGRS